MGLSPDVKFENSVCDQEAVHNSNFETRLVTLCTPPGGINGLPGAKSVQHFLAHLPCVDAAHLTAAFAARLQDDHGQRPWQVRAKALLLMQMLVEIKPFAEQYTCVFAENARLLQRLEFLRLNSPNHVVREGARKLLSLIRSNGTNAALIPKESPTKPHVRSEQKKSGKSVTTSEVSKLRLSPGKVAVNKVFRPEPMTVSTSLDDQSLRPPIVMSPKVSQAIQASWRRRKSETQLEQDKSMPVQTPSTLDEDRKARKYAMATQIGQRTCQSSIHFSNERMDSKRLSAFSFVQ